MRYLIYARKSSESEDKQAQSIDDQLRELRALAAQRSLDVVDELTEARSAKAPGGRPVFAELVARVNAGEADAILCWHVNRLFRNPVDFGTISWMLQTGTLKEIHTPHQIHRFGDNVLLLSVENGMANQYILDLKRAVERGLSSKVEKGWFPHKAPEGYKNADGIIVPDPERFPRIRQVFDMALSESHSVPQILATLRSWGYTTKRLKRTGGTPISRSSLYNILSNIFYAGYFVRAGETFKGAHEPMLTLSEFFRVQKFLKRQNRRHRKHAFAFTGLITCGECGSAVVGETKQKRLADGSVRYYTYYSCSNARRTCVRKVIREEAIVGQITRVLDALSVPEEFLAFSQKVIARWKEEQLQVHEEAKLLQARAIAAVEAKMSRLLDLKLDDLLSDAEFREQKERLHGEVARARMEQQLSHEATDALWENLENAVTLLHYGKAFFEGGTTEMQNLIAQTIGARYVLTNGRLAVELNPVFGRVCELKRGLESASDSQERGGFDESCPTWWSILDAIRTELLASGAHIRNLQHCFVHTPQRK
jgi:DNA invertase Pin-like site-specific DNA recombinase